PELLAPHAALGGANVDLVRGGHQAPELALGAARLVLDGAQLGGERLVVLGRAPRLGIGAIALGGDVAGGGVGPVALLGEPRAALDQLRPSLARLGQTLRQIALDLVEARQLAPEGIDPLGHRGEIDPTRRQLGAERGLVRLGALDRVPHPGDRGLERALGVSRDRSPICSRSVANSAPSVAISLWPVSTTAASRSTSASSSRSCRLRARSECSVSLAARDPPPWSRPVGPRTSPPGVTYVATTPLRRQSRSASSRCSTTATCPSR